MARLADRADYVEAMASDAATRAPWDAVLNRYRDLATDAATFNVFLLEQLRPTWQAHVRPDTSMFTLLFTRHGETGYDFHERVEVNYETPDRVRLAFARQAPRRAGQRSIGPVVVTGDFARPENAPAVVENFLMQLSGA